MCLSVYIGSHIQIRSLNASLTGSLGIETAKWLPPTLSKYEFIYYVGRIGTGADLECSCLLSEYVVWSDDGPTTEVDDLYPEQGPCPYGTLKQYVEQGLESSGHVSIVCDDSGGLEQNSDASDYCESLIRPSMIKRGNLIFADMSSSIPWRHLYAIRE